MAFVADDLPDEPCKECGRSFSNRQGLTNHITRKHHMSIGDYSLRHYFGGEPPKCLCGCGQQTTLAARKSFRWFNEYVNGHNWEGKLRTEENKENCRRANLGSLNPMFGKRFKQSNESKRLMSSIRLKWIEEHPEWNRGERNGNWRGGIAGSPYEGFGRAIKKRIKERDSGVCRLCGSNFRLAVHHIDYDKKNSSIDNLVTLCCSCHSKTNFDRDQWQDKFGQLLAETT
jgi:hypothetical protein